MGEVIVRLQPQSVRGKVVVAKNGFYWKEDPSLLEQPYGEAVLDPFGCAVVTVPDELIGTFIDVRIFSWEYQVKEFHELLWTGRPIEIDAHMSLDFNIIHPESW